MDKKALGNKGEAFAAEYYRKLGFTVTAQNYTCRGGEIDIIAENGEYIIFVEVKTRSSNSLYSPAEAV
ncbi:MAG: YraN family protein, partial [Clostridia bacterium]|nr:YraN family protein [Clostridia bacterium]